MDPETSLALCVVEGNSQIRSDVVEIVLNPTQPGNVVVGQLAKGDRDADVRGELVDISICLDPGIRLANSAPVAQMGFTAIAGPRVDA